MKVFNAAAHQKKKNEIMEKCFDCYSEYGLNKVGIKMLATACNISSASLYTYFNNVDELIVQSTEYCMSKVEDEFMEKAPADIVELMRFIDEIPYWTAKNHGKKYRLMYQVYTNPRYNKYGKDFFDGVNKRYFEYATQLEERIHIPRKTILALIFILIRACVHYALFDDEYYLNAQITVLKDTVAMYIKQYQDSMPQTTASENSAADNSSATQE